VAALAVAAVFAVSAFHGVAPGGGGAPLSATPGDAASGLGGDAASVLGAESITFYDFVVGPARYCTPRRGMPFDSRNEGSNFVPMTWRAIYLAECSHRMLINARNEG